MKRAITTLCLILFAAVASGATVEVSTEGWTGSGVTNGWTFANLGEPFAAGAARLGDGAWIASPTWPRASVLSATVTVECLQPAEGAVAGRAVALPGRRPPGTTPTGRDHDSPRIAARRRSVITGRPATGATLEP